MRDERRGDTVLNMHNAVSNIQKIFLLSMCNYIKMNVAHPSFTTAARLSLPRAPHIHHQKHHWECPYSAGGTKFYRAGGGATPAGNILLEMGNTEIQLP